MDPIGPLAHGLPRDNICAPENLQTLDFPLWSWNHLTANYSTVVVVVIIIIIVNSVTFNVHDYPISSLANIITNF